MLVHSVLEGGDEFARDCTMQVTRPQEFSTYQVPVTAWNRLYPVCALQCTMDRQ